jgi:hypothetical protein
MLGFRLGQCKRIAARIDPEESETVLIDCNGDKAEGVYFAALVEYQELRVELGIGSPAEQYAHDCKLPNHGE